MGARRLAAERRVDRRGRAVEASYDQHIVYLVHAPRLEDRHDPVEGLRAARDEQAAGRVAVEPVDTAQRRFAPLGAEEFLQAARPDREQTARLVRKEVVLRLVEHADLARRRRPRVVRAGVDRVAALQDVPRHPDALPVDKYLAGVDQILGLALRLLQPLRQKILQGLPRFRPGHGQREHLVGMGWHGVSAGDAGNPFPDARVSAAPPTGPGCLAACAGTGARPRSTVLPDGPPAAESRVRDGRVAQADV